MRELIASGLESLGLAGSVPADAPDKLARYGELLLQQNQVMSILTVVTTIFLPLTLIAGWYGMNFPNMPEFGWKYAYPAVIIVSILVIILEIIYFKKKKML